MNMPSDIRVMLCTLAVLCVTAAHAQSPAMATASEAVTGPTEPSATRPFEHGDVFVGATLLNDPKDDHAGRGRILQFDADLNLKRVIWVEGTTHLVNGLKVAPDGTLWAFDLWAWTTVRIAPDGRQLPNLRYAERPLSGVFFADDGSLILTEALVGENQPLPNTTRYPVLPGESAKLGDGDIYRFDPEGELLTVYDPEVDGGMTGSFAVSHSAWSEDRESLIYVSETGSRVMRYDIVNRRQLPDIPREQAPPPQMHFALASVSGARLLITMGNRVELIAESGNELRTYPLEGFGWSLIALSPDEKFAYVGNWFSGKLGKLDLAGGELAALADACIKCMASIAVFGTKE
ncbi:MAG: hypothetical protein ACN4GT_11240 [Gammaproteobacteria bacterium]